jgi:hypothetical protein
MFKNALQKRLRQRFFVTPTSGLNFAGVLTECDRDEFGYEVYQDVVVYPPDSSPEPVEGVTFIRHRNVAYAQLLPPELDTPDVNDTTN